MLRVSILFFALMSPASHAATITGLLYSVGDELRTVDFDGTQFTSPLTVLEPLVPAWDAMAYDPYGDRIFYTVGDELRVVDFDGTQFISALSVLEPLVPAWDSMSLVYSFDDEGHGIIPLPPTIWLAGAAFCAFGMVRRRGPGAERTAKRRLEGAA